MSGCTAPLRVTADRPIGDAALRTAVSDIARTHDTISRLLPNFPAQRNTNCVLYGMSPSEAAAVTAASEAWEVSHFFESGVSNGASTTYFARYFAGLQHHSFGTLNNLPTHVGKNNRVRAPL